MAGTISVTPEELRRSAQDVNGKVNEYVSLYRKLYGEVDSIGTHWTGEANQNYVKQIKGFEKEFENLKNVLTAYVDFLNEAARVYEQTEANIRDGAGKLTTGR